MNNILIGILAIFAVGGAWKGGIKTIFSLLSFSGAFMIAYFFYGRFAGLLFDGKFLCAPLTDAVNGILGGLNRELTVREFSSMGEMSLWVGGIDLPYYVKSFIISILQNISFDGKFTVSQVISSPLYKIVLEALSFVFIFIVSFLVFKILQHFLQIMVRFSFLRITDKVLGFIVGIAFGVAVYFVFVYFLVLLSKVLLSNFLIEKINEGYLSSIFYGKIIK